jgi:hypothetical protein
MAKNEMTKDEIMSRLPVSCVVRASTSLTALARRNVTLACAAAFLTVTGPSLAQTANAPAAAVADDPLVARVAGAEIRRSDLRIAEQEIDKTNPPQQGEDPAARRNFILTYMADLIVLSKAAQTQNVSDPADLARHAEFARKQTLRDKLLTMTSEAATTEDNLHKLYDDYVARNPPVPEYHLRAMVFKFPGLDNATAVSGAEAKAKAAIERVKKGEDFTAVAASVGEDDAAKISHGEIGYLTKEQMGKEYADIVSRLKPGEMSAPIKTQFGWHVVQFVDERTRQILSFEEMHDRLAAFASRNAQVQLIDQLRKASPLELLDVAGKEKPADAAK